MSDDPAQFYTGLVAELYAPLRSANPDPRHYEAFVRATGEPALELGCGDGDPLLALRAAGLDVEGLDSSADMIQRARARADELGLDVVLHHADMRRVDLSRTYRSIYLAGPTFNLLETDSDAVDTLRCIRRHLADGGRALVPLFVPDPPSDRPPPPAAQTLESGDTISCGVVSVERDEERRTQVTTLRYRRDGPTGSTELDRPWLLHWYDPSQFTALAQDADLRVTSSRELDGTPATDVSTYFVTTLEPA